MWTDRPDGRTDVASSNFHFGEASCQINFENSAGAAAVSGEIEAVVAVRADDRRAWSATLMTSADGAFAARLQQGNKSHMQIDDVLRVLIPPLPGSNPGTLAILCGHRQEERACG
jgi:hypothetical protein